MSRSRAEALLRAPLLALLLPAPALAAPWPPEAAAALAGDAPASARALLEARLAADPGDGAAVVALARIELAAGDTASAHRRLAAYLAGARTDADAWLALGQVLLRAGRPADAASCFSAAEGLSADPALRRLAAEGAIASLQALGPAGKPALDARLAEADRAGALAVPPALRARAIAAAPEAPAGAASQAPPAGRRWEIRPAVSADALTNGNAPWLALALGGAWLGGPRARLGAAAGLTQRFGESDATLALDGSWPLTDALTAGFEAGLAPGATVIPYLLGGGGLHLALPDGWGVEASGRYSLYAGAEVPFTELSAEKYLGAWRFAYSLGVSPSPQWAWPLRHLATVAYYLPDDRSALTLRAALGTEVQQVSASRIVSTDVQGLALELAWWPTEGLGFVPAVAYTRQGSLYDRFTAGLSAVTRF